MADLRERDRQWIWRLPSCDRGRLGLINRNHLEWLTSQMQNQNLKNAVTTVLDHIGRVRILEVMPDLDLLKGWTNGSLAGIMMDSKDVILDEEYLLFFRDFFAVPRLFRINGNPASISSQAIWQ